MEHWFYMRTMGQTIMYDDRTKEMIYPLASVMSEMSPLSRVNPSTKATLERQACDKAFALVCRYFRG
jgi:hypothetical protein